MSVSALCVSISKMPLVIQSCSNKMLQWKYKKNCRWMVSATPIAYISYLKFSLFFPIIDT